jgi:hypothetical protein
MIGQALPKQNGISQNRLMSYVRFLNALLVCTFALILPYRLRVTYMRWLAALAHFPYKIFGAMARLLLRTLEEKNPYDLR